MNESLVFFPDQASFEALWQTAAPVCSAALPGAREQTLRVKLWRKTEFHNWLRWRICRAGFDWSKPLVIALLAMGFAALIAYGAMNNQWYLTAGGIVAWFSVVNLSFFVYFGLTLPGPPLPLPGPVEPPGFYRAEMGLYPPGYERRKLARVWLRLNSSDGTVLRFEFALPKLEPALGDLLRQQTLWRMQRGDAPLTHAVVEFTPTSRGEIDAGQIFMRVAAWKWDAAALTPFERGGPF